MKGSLYETVTQYQVRIRVWDPVIGRYKDEAYTGLIWDEDEALNAQDELWDAKHDEMVDSAYIREITQVRRRTA